MGFELVGGCGLVVVCVFKRQSERDKKVCVLSSSSSSSREETVRDKERKRIMKIQNEGVCVRERECVSSCACRKRKRGMCLLIKSVTNDGHRGRKGRKEGRRDCSVRRPPSPLSYPGCLDDNMTTTKER